ncbi:MAG: VOC family protein [Anaerolineales bacterium]|nr:VOC family protein [Anaerolineales bacterium]
MADKLVMNLHHTSVLVADVDEAFDRYSVLLGMHGEKMDGCALMRCMHEDFCLVLKPAGGRKPFLDYVAYELAPGLSLTDAAREIERRGEKVEHISVPQRGAGLLLHDADGNRVVLVERVRPKDPRSPVMIPNERLLGYHPRRLGHVNYLTGDVQAQFKWYTEILGFKLTDWIGDAGLWLHVDPRHHVLAFLEKGYPHIHHTAFELVDFGEMRAGLDHIARHGRYVTWGPVRHGMAQNLAAYWRMWEEEHFIEFYCDMQVLDADHVPFTHPDDPYASNTWGILPPRSYFKFDPESVKMEREQVHAFLMP